MNDTMIIMGIFMAVGTVNMSLSQPTAQGWIDPITHQVRNTVTATFENDIYVTWVDDKTSGGDGEVFYRLSGDAGKTFTDKISLSNTPKSDSVDVEISADEGKVAISWWEHTQKMNEPVMRVSIDGGKTFGPLLKLASNGTIGS